MSIKDEMLFTGHWTHVESRFVYMVTRSGKNIPMTQEQFASWLRSWEQQFFFHSMA